MTSCKLNLLGQIILIKRGIAYGFEYNGGTLT